MLHDFGDFFGDAESTVKDQTKVLTSEQIDERQRRLADQANWTAARIKAQDTGFITEVLGDAEEISQVAAIGQRRLALFSRDCEQRENLLREFASDIEGYPIAFLPAEAVLESERLLEALHLAICRRMGLPQDMPVEDVITWLGHPRIGSP